MVLLVLLEPFYGLSGEDKLVIKSPIDFVFYLVKKTKMEISTHEINSSNSILIRNKDCKNNKNTYYSICHGKKFTLKFTNTSGIEHNIELSAGDLIFTNYRLCDEEMEAAAKSRDEKGIKYKRYFWDDVQYIKDFKYDVSCKIITAGDKADIILFTNQSEIFYKILEQFEKAPEVKRRTYKYNIDDFYQKNIEFIF